MATRDKRSVDDYMELPYRVEIYWDENYWAAEFPELPYLAAGHETWEGLKAAIEEAKRAWFESMLTDGKPIPEPRMPANEYSGQLRVRLPKSLHAQAAHAAERDEVSLNTFIVTAVAQAVARG
jgi:antitoxin HicB